LRRCHPLGAGLNGFRVGDDVSLAGDACTIIELLLMIGRFGSADSVGLAAISVELDGKNIPDAALESEQHEYGIRRQYGICDELLCHSQLVLCHCYWSLSLVLVLDRKIKRDYTRRRFQFSSKVVHVIRMLPIHIVSA